MHYINSFMLGTVHVLKNISDFLSSLTLIDVIFFFSIILLMILVVTLLYFIKVNQDVYKKEEKEIENKIFDENLAVDESLKADESAIDNNRYIDEGELIDLTSISKALENLDNSAVDLTAFEEEQEKDAIISYDELLNKTKTGSINYKNETMLDDLVVKEVDLDNLINEASAPEEIDITKSKVISYSQEEAFLEALKNLQKHLN